MKSKLAYYKILKLNPTATLDDIKRAYRRLAKVYHPDLNPDDKLAEEKFKEILEAYQALKEPISQVKYSQYTSTQSPPIQEEYPFEKVFSDFSYHSVDSSKEIFLEIFLTISFYSSIIILMITPFLEGKGNNTVYSWSGSSLILYLLFTAQGYWLTGWFFGLLALFGWLPVVLGECSWKVGLFASSALIGVIISAVITLILFLCFKLKNRYI